MTKKIIPILLLLALALIVGTAFGLASTNYRLDWFTPLTSGSGGTANSTNYALAMTIGQSSIGSGHSTQYNAALGYWASPNNDQRAGHMVYLPVILR